ncbi:hypothetical protein T484DRAFT_1934148 [Baffinella frigidus]|nr:hypothetical protein T484DRAFT_1934148 [Cryptophyta sp. CCMP2293]
MTVPRVLILRALVCVCLPASTAWVQVASLHAMPRPHLPSRGCGLRALQACASTAASTQPVVLEREDWTSRAEAHRMRVLEMLRGGMRVGDAKPDGTEFGGLDPANPIYNFLLDYYNIRGRKGTKRLARWSPGLNVVLRDAEYDRDVDAINGLLARKCVPTEEGGGGLVYSARHLAAVDAGQFAKTFGWYRSILQVTEENQPVLNCFGLHEWAMVYRPAGAEVPASLEYQKDVLPLRVSQDEINEAVERTGIQCTHVDAIRFFAPSATPFNVHAGLEREDQMRLENPACVHASMDLLKIAMKIVPFIPSNLLADALEVSLAARRLDVAASPYDASAFHLAPVKIETAEGRIEYRDQQLELMKRSAPVRTALLRAYDDVLRDPAFLSARASSH